MRITLFTIGKLKDRAYGDLQVHYLKLIRPFYQMDIEELPDEPIKKGMLVSTIQEKESARVLKWIDPSQKLIVLDDRGKQFSSFLFAEWLKRFHDEGEPLQFIIGGPYGLSASLKKRANETIALSSLTFPHQLARIIFLEQLYRSFTIIKGKTYHY